MKIIKNKMPSVRFVFDRKNTATSSKVANRKQGVVQLELSYKRKRKFTTTGIKLYSDQWSEKKQKVINSVNAIEYNNILNAMMSEALDRILKISRSGNPEYSILFEEKLDVKEKSFCEFARNNLKDVPVKDSTKLMYTNCLQCMERSKIFGLVSALRYSQLDKYQRYLCKQGYRDGTICLYLTFAKRMMKLAYNNGLVEVDPTKGFKLPKHSQKDRVYLTADEVEQVRNIVPENDAQMIVKDFFIFQCYTGMSYIDVVTLDKSMIKHYNDKVYIERNRTKTQQRYKITMLKPALDILVKYNYEIPKISVYNYDHILERMCRKAGINKKITSHVGRHTFATMALSYGVPIEIVSKMLGHSNINTTQIYAKILAKDVDAQFDRLGEFMK